MHRIIGTKIRKLRESYTLTQEELAKAVGLSSEFISLLELGKRDPSLDTLSALSDFFGKDISFFLIDKEDDFSVLLERKEIKPGAKKELLRFKKYCEDYLFLENCTEKHLDLAPFYSHGTALKLAADERKRIGLGTAPLIDIFSLVELNGLRILRQPIPDDMDIAAVFIFIESKQSAFSLINARLSPSQQVFAVAHQYSHYLKDREDDPIIDNPDVLVDDYIHLYPSKEQFAQNFALEFLIPGRRIQEIVRREILPSRIKTEDVLYLKRCFGVGITHILRSLLNFEFISSAEYSRFLKIPEEKAEKSYIVGLLEQLAPNRPKKQQIISDRFVRLAFEAYRKKKIKKDALSGFLQTDTNKIDAFMKTGS